MGRAPNVPVGVQQNDKVFKGDIILVDDNAVERLRFDSGSGSVRVRDADGSLVCHMEFPGANIRLGGHGKDGDLLLFRRDADGLADADDAAVHLDADSGKMRFGGNGADGIIVCRDAGTNQTVLLDGARAEVAAGGSGQDGHVVVQDKNNAARVVLHGDTGQIEAGGNGSDGQVRLRDSDGNSQIVLSAKTGRVIAGGNGVDGEFRLRMADGQPTVSIKAQGGDPGPVATLEVGAEGVPGSISTINSQGSRLFNVSPNGTMTLGAAGFGDGRIMMFDRDGIGTILDGKGHLVMGGASDGAHIQMRQSSEEDSSPATIIDLNADTGIVKVGGGSGHGVNGRIQLKDKFENVRILLDAESGDITLPNGDIAEEFTAAVAAAEHIEPGMVVVFDDDASLCLTDKVSDPRVAGIIAGAGQERPGIVLGRNADRERPVQLALTGRVWVHADAASHPIKVGDLLVTGTRPGHVQAQDGHSTRAGTIVGKAMGALDTGQGLIPVLVMLR